MLIQTPSTSSTASSSSGAFAARKMMKSCWRLTGPP
jgi:hypothetical protein